MDDWFTLERIDEDTDILSEYRHWEETHCYLLRGRERSLLIDTGLGICDIRQAVDRLTDRPVAAVATHIHWDHIGGHRYFPEFYAHEAELNWLSGGFPLSVEAVRAMVADRCCLPEDFDVSRYTLFQGHPARVLRDGDRIELGGLDRPTSGTVMVDGQDIFSLKEEALTIFRRRKIGFVFQAYNLVPVLNVYENIVLPIELDGGKVNKDFVQQIVQTLGLDDRLDALPNQLSGGQQQRVAIARALAAAPTIILADEPTGNLDSKTSQDVLSLLKVTSQKFAQTIVMITHNEEIAQMADRIIRIEDGRIVSQN